jgi:hypothetical protein
VPNHVFPYEALASFRLRLLQRSRSLHEAFAAYRDRPVFTQLVGRAELLHTLSKLAADSQELLDAAGPNMPHQISLLQMYNWLVTSSSEGLLWELRASLKRASLWPPPHGSLEEEARLLRKFFADLDGSSHYDRESSALAFVLNRDDWLQFAKALGLMRLESNQMFDLMCGPGGTLTLRSVVEHVQATVAPDASLVSLASRLIHKYGSIREAFANAACSVSPNRFLRVGEFRKLIEKVGFANKRSATKFWTVMLRRVSLGGWNRTGMTVSLDQARAEDVLDEESFVKSLLYLTPDSIFQEISESMRSHFGSLHEARRVLRRQGLPSSVPLTPVRLQEVMRQAGITHGDGDLMISVTRSFRDGCDRPCWDGHPDGDEQLAAQVTFDDVLAVMRSRGRSHAKADLSQTASLMNHLHLQSPGLARSPSPESQCLAGESDTTSEF